MSTAAAGALRGAVAARHRLLEAPVRVPDEEQDVAARAVPPQVAADPSRNEVLLVGRVSGAPEERELPSGDVLVAFRVVVQRRPGRPARSGVRSTSIDALECVGWTSGVRRTARTLADGDVVSVEGALRRRFWRAGAGAASRTEVEVERLRRVTRRAAG